MQDLSRRPTPRPPSWAPLGATRVGGAIGALVGVTAVVNFGDNAAWAMMVSALVGAVLGFSIDRHHLHDA